MKKAVLILGSLLLIAGVALILTGAGKLSVVSMKFTATAQVKLLNNVPRPPPGPNRGFFNSTPPLDSRQVKREMDRIVSTEILNHVISNLDLTQRWAARDGRRGELKPEEVQARLKRQIDVRQGREQSILIISVESDDKNEAAEIANNVAAVLRDTRPSHEEVGPGTISPRLKAEIVEFAKVPAGPSQVRRTGGYRVIALGVPPTALGIVLLLIGLLLRKPSRVPPKLR